MNAQQKADLDNRISRVHIAGGCKGYTKTEFKNYLLQIGLNRYEKIILPVETEREYPTSEPIHSNEVRTWTGYFRSIKKTGNVIFPEWD